MKKVLLSVFVILGLVVALPVTTSADSNKQIVSGTITSNGSAVKHARVEVTCNGHDKHDKTNKHGFYQVKFKKGDCPQGSNVTVTASKDGKTGTGQGTVSGNVLSINVSISTTVIQAPEMGTYASVAALALGGGAFMVVRRKQQASKQ